MSLGRRSFLLLCALGLPAGALAAASIPADKIFSPPHGRFHQGLPGKPAVLLFHGTSAGMEAWIAPAGTPRGLGEFYYDHTKAPPPYIDDNARFPGLGVHALGLSPRDKDAANRRNWWDYLVAKGFTVATWSQTLPLFAEGYASAEVAYAEFLRRTGDLPVALVGHSRGGLLARRLLIDHGARGRVRWLITLHAPHRGTRWGTAVHTVRGALLKLLQKRSRFPYPKLWRDFDAAVRRALLKQLDAALMPAFAEQRPGSPLIRDLEARDRPIDGVQYFTYGGTSPRVLRFYAWVYAKGSATPHLNGRHIVYHRRADPKEIPLVSPMWDKLPNPERYDEIRPGKGDLLVSDASARLPWSVHKSFPISHGDVLLSERLQSEVSALLQ